MSPLPVITGIGLVTPLGKTPEETWTALLSNGFIQSHARANLDTPPTENRLHHLAHTAATQALTQSGWTQQQGGHDPTQTALLVATSKGPIESWLNAHTALLTAPRQSAQDAFRAPSSLSAQHSALSTCLGLADLATQLSLSLTLPTSLRQTLSAACSSGLHALARAALLLHARQATRVLVIAAESSLHPLFTGSFQRLGVLPRPDIGCRPFDATRDGFLMSEAAAALCLEFPTHAANPPLAALENVTLLSDAHHLTAPDPSGKTLRHLITTTTRNLPVDLVHAHATGTLHADPVELAALEQTVGAASNPPSLYSHKAALGHSLGAAGLVSIVLNTLAHQTSLIPGNIRTTTPLPTDHLVLSPHKHDRRITRSLALASGFAGPLAAATLRSP